MNKVVSVFLVSVLLICSFAVPCFAEEYSQEYPRLFNSGSPLWLHCEIQGMGEYVIVIDPNTNPQAFGFDSPDGYGLINNTADTIVGRAYNVNSSAGYMARWLSFYKLQLQTGSNQYGQQAYEDYDITKIYGTTLDLVDYVGNRGNDLYKHDIPDRLYKVIIASVVTVILFLFVMFLLVKPRLIRM